MQPHILSKDVEKVKNYLNKKQAWHYGYIRYSIFRKMIRHVSGHMKLYFIRKIFLQMIADDLFNKKKTNKRSYLYKFKNIKETNIVNKQIVITFD